MSRTEKRHGARPPARPSTWWSSPSPVACNTKRRCSAPPSGPRCPTSPAASSSPNRNPAPAGAAIPASPTRRARPAGRARRRDTSLRSKVFGESYPHGNKIECLTALPKGEPFVFFDSDTLILATWPRCRSISTAPRPRCGWKAPGRRSSFTAPATPRSGNRSTTGSALISKARSTSPARRVLAPLPLFQRGFFYYRCPACLRVPLPGDRARHPRRPAAGAGLPVPRPLARPGRAAARDPRPRRRARRAGSRDGWTARISCHYRLLPLLYAREPDRVVEILEPSRPPTGSRRC
jgi:hypothetical protein